VKEKGSRHYEYINIVLHCKFVTYVINVIFIAFEYRLHTPGRSHLTRPIPGISVQSFQVHWTFMVAQFRYSKICLITTAAYSIARVLFPVVFVCDFVRLSVKV